MNEVLNVGQMLSVNASLYPDRPAARDSRRALSYAQFEERANRLANALGGLGLVRGDRLAVYAYNCLEWMEIYAACAKSGVVAVPVNFRLTAAGVRHILADSGAVAVMAGADFAATIDEIRADVPLRPGACVLLGGEARRPHWRCYEELLASGSAAPPAVRVRPEDPWTLMYTSGTTGRPKGAVRSHLSYSLFYLLTSLEFGFHRGDTGLAVMPLCHVNSVFFGFVFTYLGASVCVYDHRSFDPEHLLDTLAAERITFTSLVPTHYVMMLEVPERTRSGYDLRSVDKLLISSAPARRETKLAVMERFPSSRLFEAYGSTEAGLVTLLRPEQQFQKLGSIGREIFGTGRLRLLGADGVEVPEGEVGELYSLTPTTFDGYWRMPEETRTALRDGYCSAGDMARRDADGFYTLVDRKSNVIITGGEKVFPSEVEQAMAAHPDVQEVAVIGLPDAKWGEAVTAVVVTRPGQELAQDVLIRHAHDRLAGYQCPRRVVFISDEEMPRTVTGKVLHRLLRDRYTGPPGS